MNGVEIDYDFCKSRYGYKSNEAIDQAFHTEKPIISWRTFSLDFCPLEYLKLNEDVFSANVNPVDHYMKYGKSEGRPVSSIVNQQSNNITYIKKIDTTNYRIVFVFHVFYESFLQEIFTNLKNLNALNKLVIVTCPEDISNNVENSLSDLDNMELVVKNTPNIGRNMYPFFGLVSDLISENDIIFHIHSKQSRFSGRQQLLWAKYLTYSLMGSEEIVLSHVKEIQNDYSNLISPKPFPLVPGWASHTLKNNQKIRDMGFDVAGYLAYPVGGMFVMSSDLYRRVAEFAFNVDKYPNEPSSNDGEFHHAIERIIGIISGNGQKFFDPILENYLSPDTVLRAEFQRIPKVNWETIRKYDIVSFDFFDTLFTRATGWENYAKHQVSIFSGSDYHSMRDDTENILRADIGITGDVSLLQIASRIDRVPEFPPFLLTQIERKVDLDSLIPRHKAIQLLNKCIEAEKHVLITTDTYYGEPFFKSVLSKIGVNVDKLNFLVSTETGLRKDYGTVWNKIREIANNRSVVHIGDNVVSDIQFAADMRIDTSYIPHWRDSLLVASGLNRNFSSMFLFDPHFCQEFSN